MQQGEPVVRRGLIELCRAKTPAAHLEAGHKNAVGGNKSGAPANRCMLGTRGNEDQDVAGQGNRVEASPW